jgi:hypothetical protein
MHDTWDIFDKIPTEETTADGFDWSIFDKPNNKIEGATDFENATINSFRAMCLHPKSQNLPINSIVTSVREQMEIVRNSPKVISSEFDAFSDSPEESKLRDLNNNSYSKEYIYYNENNFQSGITNDDIKENFGWKLHLNVTPEDSILVSRWLKINNFAHKFLSGGDISDGKIFTVYIGSYDLCTKMSKKIFDSLNQYLCKPADNTEIEIEPGIIGRFVCGDKSRFRQYGTCGFSEIIDNNGILNKSQDQKDQKTLLSFRKLSKEFGDYFYHT